MVVYTDDQKLAAKQVKQTNLAQTALKQHLSLFHTSLSNKWI